MRQDRCSGTTQLFQLLFRQSHQIVRGFGAADRASLRVSGAGQSQQRRDTTVESGGGTDDAVRSCNAHEAYEQDLAYRILA
jgi:hypothetical protein